MIGSELYVQESSIMYRTAIQYDSSIQLLDLTICTYRHWINIESASNHSTLMYGEIELQQPNLAMIERDTRYIKQSKQILNIY
ncbi:hypothetical protein D3C77_398170 [compost metagenome]